MHRVIITTVAAEGADVPPAAAQRAFVWDARPCRASIPASRVGTRLYYGD